MNKCVLILPYFGEFNNYFDMFLKTCGYNKNYNWIIITDNRNKYKYPNNVKIIYMTLNDLKILIEKKVKFSICLNTPYKLCDYKPAYGFIFEEYIENYEYWGHCDCDLLFGNLEKLLTPILDKNFNKIFAAGHLTIYKNNFDNNRVFMSSYNGVQLYRDAFTTDKIYVLDEDWYENNVHSIFIRKDPNKVYCNDLSMNVAVNSAKFIRDAYNSELREFSKEAYIPSRYYWDLGNVISIHKNDFGKIKIIKKEYMYIHLQQRKMRIKKSINYEKIIEILPDRFVNRIKLPENLKELKEFSIEFTYLSHWDTLTKKLKRRFFSILAKILKRKRYEN